MNRRGSLLALVRALLAAIFLLVLVIGPPLLLVRVVGWPLPTRLPTVDQLRDTLGGSTVDDATIVKTLALVCWAAWLQIVASAFVEAQAWARGTVSRRVPLGGFVQPAVRRLVVTVALVLAGVRSVQPGPLPSATFVPVASASASAVAEPPSSLDPAVAAPAVAPVPAVAASTAGTITVKPRDSLWRLAERHLGDGMRWREIWDLNRDRTFPDGRVLRNPNLIRPGWVLTCPPDAVDLDAASVEPVPDVASPSPQAAPAEPPPEAEVTLSAPADGRSQAGEAVSAAATTVPASDSPVSHPESRPAPDQQSEQGAPISLIAGSLIAAGFVALLDRLRRIQLRRRQAGHAPAPVPAAAASETTLRCAAVDAPTERLDLALRSFAGCLATVGERLLPDIAVVSVGSEAVEIVLTEGVDAKPGPFEVSADGRAWTLPATAPLGELERAAAGQAAPAPALVTVGAMDDREVLIDLEASPRIVVTGDRGAARRTVWSIGLELTTSSWADDIEVIVLGDSDDSLERLERATVTSDLDEVVGRLQRAASATERDLVAAGATSTLACRVHNPGDPWTPIVLLAPEPLPESELQRVFDLVAPGRGVAALAVGDPGVLADRELRVEPTAVTLLPLGLHMKPAFLPDDLLEGVEELLTAALSDEPGDDLLAVSRVDVPPPDQGSWSPLAPAVQGVLVSVLGPVGVRGGERSIARRRSLELVVYLALHPEGADEGRLRAALWPDTNPSRENFNQTVSRARQPLGHASDGTLHLPRLNEEAAGRYRLGPAVTSDAALLEAAYVAARREPSDEAVEHLASILELVRGIPFEGTKGGWQWTFIDGHASRLASLAADAAHLVAQWLLERGDVQRALWATSQGLRAAPGDEVLYRDRMQAHDSAGNIAGVEAVMDELRRTVEDGEPYDSIHPDTLAYYETLTHQVRRTG